MTSNNHFNDDDWDDLPDEEEDTEHSDDVWVTDPKTGKRYKKIHGVESDKIKNFIKSKGNLSLQQMKSMIKEDDDVNGFFDLEESAKIFLPHLQVPPTKKELSELRREKRENQKKQLEEYKKEQLSIKNSNSKKNNSPDDDE